MAVIIMIFQNISEECHVQRCNIGSALSGITYRLGIMLLGIVFLAAIPAAGIAEENAAPKPKKPRFELTPVILQDNKTGLMWTVNANIAERTFSWEGARDYLVRMNMDSYAGYGDWRMPSRAELETLIGHVKSMGFDGAAPEKTVAAGLRNIGIENVQPDGYWTATSSIYDSAEAWQISMANGASSMYEKTLYFSLWPVRSLK